MKIRTKIFNESQKLEYIDYEEKGKNKEKSKQWLINYFRRLFEGEKRYGKDIADMSVEEAKETLTLLKIRREDSRGQLLSLLRRYVDWAILNGKTKNANIINSITPESIVDEDAVTSRMIKNPEQVSEILDKALGKKGRYFSQDNRVVRGKLVFWLMYSGMTIEELQSLKKTDIDLDSGIVTTDKGIKYNIPSDVLPLWAECCEIKYIERFSAKSNDISACYELVNNENLFRPIVDNDDKSRTKCTVNTFISIISRIFALYRESTGKEIQVSPSNIRWSGIFYRLYMLEKSGADITPKVIAKHLNIWDDSCNDRGRLLAKTRKWRIDYDDWKIAFKYM